MPTNRKKLTDYQILSELLNGKIEESDLSAHQTDKLRRVRRVYNMLLDAASNIMIVEDLSHEFGLSDAQAWRDLHLTEALYGNMRVSNKNMKRQVAENMALETYRLARDSGDVKGMAAANRNYNDATGIGIEDMDLPDFDKLQPNFYAVVLDEEIRGLFMDLIKKSGGSLDLSKVIENAEDAQIDNSEGTDKKGN